MPYDEPEAIYYMALQDPNRIINGDQYNALYKAFRPNMPNDEATRSFIATNYVMIDDFNAWRETDGYDVPQENGNIENSNDMALQDRNRIIDGDQYNALYKIFRPNMPDDEATRSFIAANYVMKDDFNAWRATHGYDVPQENGNIENLYNMALQDRNRIINGDQYNALYKAFRPNMPDDEATRSFLAANYVMKEDFNAWYKNLFKQNTEFVDTVVVNANMTRSAEGQYTATAVFPNFNLKEKLTVANSLFDNFQSVRSFSSGFSKSLDNNFTFGGVQAVLNPPADYSLASNIGKVAGDVYSLFAGGSMLVGGGAETGGGLLITASGAGAPVGVPLTLSGAATMAYGGIVTRNASRNLMKDYEELYLNAKAGTPTDRQKEHIFNGELDAARREAAGEVVARKSDGTPWNHVKELQDAQRGLLNRIKELKKQLNQDDLTDAQRKAMTDELSEASKLLDKTEEFLPR